MKQARKLDVYFEYEEKIMSKTTLDKSLLDIISDPDGMYHKFEVNISFSSDTDSEVVAHLLDKYNQKNKILEDPRIISEELLPFDKAVLHALQSLPCSLFILLHFLLKFIH